VKEPSHRGRDGDGKGGRELLNRRGRENSEIRKGKGKTIRGKGGLLFPKQDAVAYKHVRGRLEITEIQMRRRTNSAYNSGGQRKEVTV